MMTEEMSGIPDAYLPQDEPQPELRDRSRGKPMEFMDHLEELRTRILRSIVYAGLGAIIGWFLYDPYIYDFMMRPMKEHLDPHKFPITWTTIMEPLLMRMQVSAIAGVLLLSPLIFCEIWLFVYPALLPKERRYLIPVIPASFLLFVAGVAFAYFGVPVLFLFASKFVTNDSLVLNTVKWYIPFLTKVCLAMGLVFQMPVAFFLLAKLGLVNAKFLASKWRHAIVIIFVASAIITPTPDPVNMTLLAAPILGLYFLSILVVMFAQPRGKTDEDLAG